MLYMYSIVNQSKNHVGAICGQMPPTHPLIVSIPQAPAIRRQRRLQQPIYPSPIHPLLYYLKGKSTTTNKRRETVFITRIIISFLNGREGLVPVWGRIEGFAWRPHCSVIHGNAPQTTTHPWRILRSIARNARGGSCLLLVMPCWSVFFYPREKKRKFLEENIFFLETRD